MFMGSVFFIIIIIILFSWPYNNFFKYQKHDHTQNITKEKVIYI